MKVLVTLSTFSEVSEEPLLLLKKANLEVVTNPYGRKLTLDESRGLYTGDISGVIAGTEQISSEILNQSKSLRVISRCGVGTENIDLAAAKLNKIDVYITAAAVVDAVAELTLGLIFTCLRNIPYADRSVRNGSWKRPMGSLLRGKHLGVVGLGRIGKRVAEMCSGLRVNISVYDTQPDSNFINQHKIKLMNLDELLQTSDVITVHLPVTSQTVGLFNKEKFSLMKRGAFFINTSRGEMVDESALYDAVKTGKLSGAGLDVFQNEPYKGSLGSLDNVVLTSHIGSYAKEARIAMEIEAVENLLKGLKK